MSYDPFEIEAPEPGAVFYERVIHPDNQQLLEGDPRARKLSAAHLKSLKRKLKQHQRVLDDCHYDDEIQRLEKLKELIIQSKADLVGCEDKEEKKRLQVLIKRCVMQSKKIMRELIPARPTAALRQRLTMRLEEHDMACSNERLYKQLQKDMQSEVSYFLGQLVMRWSALGYKQEIHKDGKTTVDRVKFEQIIVTEDEIHFKILASRIGLFGSAQHYLPEGVRVYDLVKPETLYELAVACERPVTSPHNAHEEGGEGKEPTNGAWVTVHRIGMNGGLFNYIELGPVLRKFNQANRHRFPVSFGVRRGRTINYCFLDAHPHILIDGQTFTGKTNAFRQAICQMTQIYSPDEIRLILVDLKRGGDFNAFGSIPHVISFEDEGSIVKTPDLLENILKRLVALMYKRLALISEVAVDITKYNSRVAPDQKLPRIVVVIDEYAAISIDRMKKIEVNQHCIMIATQGRAAGIQLFIGTQQSYADSVPKEVHANITFKLTGRQMTLGASLSSMGTGYARRMEKLPGRMFCNDGREEFPVQIPYATDSDMERAITAASDYPAAQNDVWLLDDTEDFIPVQIGFGKRLLIKTAMEELGGDLKARVLWDMLRGKYHEASRPTITRLVSELISEEIIHYDGTVYTLVKQKGNFYKMHPLDDKLSSPQGVSLTTTSLEANPGTKDESVYQGWQVVKPAITEASK